MPFNLVEVYKFFNRVSVMFIPNKEKRRSIRRNRLDKYIEKKVRSYKWGVSYSVFDGVELLEYSIKSIRNCVDYINVVYQKTSWYGNPASEDLLPILTKLKEKGLIDELIEYKSNPKIYASKQERNKRNLGLKFAKKAGVNYFMTMDCDEFYVENEVKKAQSYIVENSISHSFCDIFNYYSPTKRYLAPTVSYINFFSKINIFSRLVSHNNRVIALVDSTRQLNNCLDSKYWFLHCIAMHHMTNYRKDYKLKIMNATIKGAHSGKPPMDNCVDVPDIFNISGIIKED